MGGGGRFVVRNSKRVREKEQSAIMDETIGKAIATLREAGVDTPEHDVKLLLAEAAGCELSDVDKAMLMGDPIDYDAERFGAMLARRANREPLQYIVGHAPFRYLDLEVGPGVFIPRQETELVAQEGIDWITRNGLYNPRVVDLCAGSGAIGLSIVTEVPGSHVWGVEINQQAAAWTRRNIAATMRRWPALASNYELEIGDATNAATLAKLDGSIDMVITNPPYVPQNNIPDQPEVRDHDPELALYGGSADGTLIPERIIRRASRLLRAQGLFVMEHDISQGDRLAAFARINGFEQVHVRNDYTNRPRYLVAVKSAI